MEGGEERGGEGTGYHRVMDLTKFKWEEIDAYAA